ncbi:murein DD-endopeptidase MepM/ murein hydrolase activator NlpD [Brevundimonas alba]|uniref:Murein DD-endopeptidase MepM/ murein hydrolase activator NlpD n=1 Tax=Brevundimonas alba TaxID=74314 RepID=A0A7X5YMY9_9CAUL|nr:M23 family metallopeptidase [Brevundimonas alba]NJC42166.1 murein DD-endopeptidase MepM/ murein hydrolase activator NlpD [Brevundimonas alba]
MIGIRTGLKALVVLGAMSLMAACASYPAEPRYSIYAEPAPATRAPAYPTTAAAPAPTGEGVRGPTNPAYEAPPPSTAPVDEIEGGALDAPVGTTPRYDAPSSGPVAAAGPASEGFSSPPPPARSEGAVTPGASYEIQKGDTISGIGRRFQTPVQTLIDLNSLGPRADVSPGQRIVLPADAVDIGGDPYATGPSPTGVYVPDAGVPPPPPPPPSTVVPPARQPAATAAPVAAPPVSTTVALDWPVRGDILRRFGPVGMGERNNGVNIGAPQGTEVRAAAGGRVGYVGDDLAGQGLTVLIVHRDGWRSVYGHLGTATVRDGDDVQAGQAIGTVGTTAGDGRPSIHFETWRMRGDEPTAIDPLSVLPR